MGLIYEEENEFFIIIIFKSTTANKYIYKLHPPHKNRQNPARHN